MESLLNYIEYTTQNRKNVKYFHDCVHIKYIYLKTQTQYTNLYMNDPPFENFLYFLKR